MKSGAIGCLIDHDHPTLAQAFDGLGAACRRCRDAAGRVLDGALRAIGRRDLAGDGRRAAAEDRLQTILCRMTARPPRIDPTLSAEARERAAWGFLYSAWRRGGVDEARRRGRLVAWSAENDRLPGGGTLWGDPRLVEEVETYRRAFEVLARGGPGTRASRRALASRVARVLDEVRGERRPGGRRSGAAGRAELRAIERMARRYPDPHDPDPVARAIHRLVRFLGDLRR